MRARDIGTTRYTSGQRDGRELSGEYVRSQSELVGDVAVPVSARQAVLFWALRSPDARPRLNWRRSSSTVLRQVCLGRPGRRLPFLGAGDMQICTMGREYVQEEMSGSRVTPKTSSGDLGNGRVRRCKGSWEWGGAENGGHWLMSPSGVFRGPWCERPSPLVWPWIFG